jgi:hypothetical protein
MCVRFSHEISVPLAADHAFPLFSPRGEQDWVPDWQPTYLSPETGETCVEMIFTTGSGDETTIWTCLEWEPRTRHARYLRTTPGSRVAFVDVVCREDGPAGTRVRVSYEFVALTRSGKDFMAAMTQQSFAVDIDLWAVLIRDHLDEKGVV